MKPIRTLLALTFTLLLATGSEAASLKPGAPAPDFSAVDSEGTTQTLSGYKGKYVVLEWFNEGCPFVKKHYESNNMQSLQKEATKKGVVWLTVISSAPGKQGFGTPAQVKDTRKNWKLASTATLLDVNGTVGRLYEAKTTPHMFVINPEGNIVYMGAIDDKSSADHADIKTSKNYVKTALDESLAAKPVTTPATTPYGCSVKY